MEVLYLLYVDESGLPRGKQDDHFVLAGLALHEEDCYPLARSLDAAQRRVLPGPNGNLELHASRIISGREEWSHVSGPDRLKVLDRSFRLLKEWTAPSGRAPVYFAVVIHKRSFPGKSALQVAYDQLLARFDSFISRLHLSGDSHRSLVIADDSSYEKLLQKITPQWKEGTAGVKKIHSLVEVPLFVDSKASRLIQAVDLVAWATFNYYERGHTQYFAKIHPRFDAQDGIQHGLTHLVRGYLSCECVPCKSRQVATIAARPTAWSKVLRP
jgi:Protein of unknown function (DUF3800)